MKNAIKKTLASMLAAFYGIWAVPAAQAYALISPPTAISTIRGFFQAMVSSVG